MNGELRRLEDEMEIVVNWFLYRFVQIIWFDWKEKPPTMWEDILAFRIDDKSKMYKTNKITNITIINIFKIFKNKEEFICESM